MSCWFPGVISGRITFPSHKILKVMAEKTSIQDLFNFIFFMRFNDDRRRLRLKKLFDNVLGSWLQKGNMKDWMNAKCRR